MIVGLPAFAAAGDGTVDVFVAGTDHALYNRHMGASAPLDGGWTNLGGRYLLAAGAAPINQGP